MPHVVAPDLVRRIGQSLRMRVVCGAQQQQGGTQGPAGDYHDVGRILFQRVVSGSTLHAADAAAGRVRLQTRDIGIRQQREVGICRASGVHADHLGVGLRVDRAGEAVEGVAPDAGAVGGGVAVRVLVQLDAKRQMERVQPLALQDVVQVLNARFVLDRRIGIGRAGPRFGGILAALAVHVVQRLGLRVVGFEHVVAQWPCRGDSVLVPQLAKVPFAKAEQGSAIHFGVAADEIVQSGMKRTAVAVVPSLSRLVGGIDEDGLGIPVVSRARQIAAALQHQDSLTGAG